jgi:hypothetical protein
MTAVLRIFQFCLAGGVAGVADPGDHVRPTGSPGLSEPGYIKAQESENKGTLV